MSIRQFLRLESASGLILMGAAVASLLLANLPTGPTIQRWLETSLALDMSFVSIDKPLLLWINDGLMAIFFLLVGLEIKREIREGQLSTPSRAILPVFAAVGGMLVPAAVYALFQGGDPATMRGWAIPAATDIAFALGILAILGTRAPLSLKIFLTAVAIIDDLGAIGIIALFYTEQIAAGALGTAVLLALALLALNRLGVARIVPYVLLGIALWVAVLKSGIHATLAGVILAFSIPLRSRTEPARSPLLKLEHGLHPWVAFGILPIFALANAGVPLHGLTSEALLSPISLGVAAGLLVGKPLGILMFSWIPIRAGWTTLPQGVNVRQLVGVSLLAGVGFTMSLFIGNLAFADAAAIDLVRLGVLAGSVLAGALGYCLLRSAAPETITLREPTSRSMPAQPRAISAAIERWTAHFRRIAR